MRRDHALPDALRTRPVRALALAGLGLLLALAPLQAGLESDIAEKRAKIKKDQEQLAQVEHTIDFMKKNPATVNPGDMAVMEGQVSALKTRIQERTSDIERLQSELTRPPQGSGSGESHPSDGKTQSPPVAPAEGGSRDTASDDKASDAKGSPSDRLKQSSLEGSAGKISAMTSSAQNMADQLKTGNKVAEGMMSDAKNAGMPPGSRGAAEMTPGQPRKIFSGGPLGAAPGTQRPLPETPAMDPSRPDTKEELALAASAGFLASFERLGLRVARDNDGRAVILDRSGRPATEQQLALLRQDIAAQPAALSRYPNFFSIVSPEQFQGLKQRYGASPESRDKEFKDVALTKDDRDFKWDKSCAKVSGECNPNAAEGSYKRDDFVPPSDLDNIWDSLDKEERALAAAAQRAAEGKTPPSRPGSAAAEDDGLISRLGKAVSSLWGGAGGSEEGTGEAGSAGEEAAVPARASPRRAGEKGQGPAVRGAREGKPSTRSLPGGKRALLWGGALTAAGLLFCLGFRRRQASRRPFFYDN